LAVAIRIDEPVSSNRNKPGDRFRISVAEDVRIDEVLVIPHGAVGEVIHAAKSGAGGKAGNGTVIFFREKKFAGSATPARTWVVPTTTTRRSDSATDARHGRAGRSARLQRWISPPWPANAP
jgi:hypothetical protein